MSNSIFPTLAGVQMGVERTAVYDTTVQREFGGRELRIARSYGPRYRYRLDFDFLRQDATTDEAAALLTFYAAHAGAWDSFLFSDPYDSAVTAQEFGAGDASTTTFQLRRTAAGSASDLLGTWPYYSASRTNLLLQSADLATTWANTASAETVNAAMAPDGSGVYADKLTEDGATNVHQVTQSATLALGMYTLSVYAKADTRTFISLGIGASAASTFNLGTGAVGTVTLGSAAISSVGNGWYRCSVTTGTTTSGATTISLGLAQSSATTNYTGTAGYGAFLWGTQLEAGVTPTRYIATTTAAVTERPTSGYEPIWEPLWASVSITNAGAATSAWTPGASGLVNFTAAPASGNALAWSGSFMRRVRFDGDTLDVQRRYSRIWKASVDLITVL
jgi:hypothetical protein